MLVVENSEQEYHSSVITAEAKYMLVSQANDKLYSELNIHPVQTLALGFHTLRGLFLCQLPPPSAGSRSSKWIAYSVEFIVNRSF